MQAKDIKCGTVSKEEREWNRYYRETMTRIGLFPTYWTMGGIQQNTRTEPKDKNERYSTNYKTAEEFSRDQNIVFNCLVENKIAPKALVDRVAATVEELHLVDL